MTEIMALPSLESLFTIKPEFTARENLSKAEEFLNLEKIHLQNLSNEEKKNLSSYEWLNRVSKECKFHLLLNDTFIQVEFQEHQIIFKLEERLVNCIQKHGFLIGLHHYSLSCSDTEYNIILKRTMILDCFTVPYNETLLKAFDSNTKIIPIFGVNNWWQFEDEYASKYPSFDNTEISELLSSHSVVPLTEFLSLSDENKIKDIYSTPIEFVSTFMTRKAIFRKIPVRNEDAYQVPGKGYFEALSSNIKRHTERINGEHLILVESVLWYDVLTKKQSSEIFQLYKDKTDKIPKSEIIGIYNTALPMYILSKNQKVMKLRKSKKVLKIPTFIPGSKEFKFCKTLLFYPLAPNVEIDTDRLGKYY